MCPWPWPWHPLTFTLLPARLSPHLLCTAQPPAPRRSNLWSPLAVLTPMVVLSELALTRDRTRRCHLLRLRCLRCRRQPRHLRLLHRCLHCPHDSGSQSYCRFTAPHQTVRAAMVPNKTSPNHWCSRTSSHGNNISLSITATTTTLGFSHQSTVRRRDCAVGGSLDSFNHTIMHFIELRSKERPKPRLTMQL